MLKETLSKRKFILGSWLNSGSPVIAEIMSACGFDFLVVDVEHSAVDVPQAQALFQAIKAGNPRCVPMVRLAGNDYAENKRYLDAGAWGVIAPLVNTEEEARELLRSAKYPPLGERGVGYGRSHGYGFAFQEYMARANEDIFICVQIEHCRAVDNLDSILSVKGIDAVLIGPYDLTASMGITAQFDHPDYIAARKKILDKCREYNITAGIHVVQPRIREAVERLKEGFGMIAYSLDITMIGTSCREALKEIGLHTGRKFDPVEKQVD
jgi:2-dehydro-3-deoxyglucarate aldolase